MFTEKKRKLTSQREALDHLLKKLKALEVSMPKKGWLRSIRESLGMSVGQLAKRASLDQTTVTRLEANEVRGAITLKSLNKLSEALECDLIYALVPKTSLKETLSERAHKFLKNEEARVEKTMRLEDQGGEEIDNTLQRATLIGNLDKRIWEE